MRGQASRGACHRAIRDVLARMSRLDVLVLDKFHQVIVGRRDGAPAHDQGGRIRLGRIRRTRAGIRRLGVRHCRRVGDREPHSQRDRQCPDPTRCTLRSSSSLLHLSVGTMATESGRVPQWESSLAFGETTPVAHHCKSPGFGALLLSRGALGSVRHTRGSGRVLPLAPQQVSPRRCGRSHPERSARR